MVLSDVHGDNDNKFVVVDFGSGTSSPQLKVLHISYNINLLKCTYTNILEFFIDFQRIKTNARDIFKRKTISYYNCVHGQQWSTHSL